MSKSVEVKAETVYKKRLLKKIIWIIFLLLIIFISVIYLFLYIVYQGGRFTVNLDKNMSNRKNIYLSENGKLSGKSRELAADTIDYMDNISIKWLPEDIDKQGTGAHNGDNYIAYTFYVINAGKEMVHYWYEIDVDDSIKNWLREKLENCDYKALLSCVSTPNLPAWRLRKWLKEEYQKDFGDA